MSCDNTYINNKPLGLSFSNTTTKPVGLAELSSITANTVSAAYWSGITLSSLSDIDFAGLDDGYVISWDAGASSWVVAAQSGGGGGGGNSFVTLVPTTGSNVVADNSNDTLTFVSNDNTISVSGNNTPDYLNFQVVASSVDHNSLANLSTGNPHPQYTLSSTNQALSSLVTSIQTSTINLSSYISSNQASWLAGGGGGGNSFVTIVPTIGTNVVADAPSAVLTFVSHDGTISVSGTGSSDTIDLSVNEASLSNIPQSSVTNLATNIASLSSADTTFSSLIGSLQTSTLNLSSYISGNQAAWAAGGAESLSDLSDIATGELADKDILVYSSGTNSWVNLPRPVLRVYFHNDAGVGATLTNQPNSEQFLANSIRSIQAVDLTNYTQVRLYTVIQTGSTSVNTPRIYLEYSPTFATAVGSYEAIGNTTVSASIATANTYIKTNWVNINEPAKAEVWVAVLMNGGDGAADPVVGHTFAEFR